MCEEETTVLMKARPPAEHPWGNRVSGVREKLRCLAGRPAAGGLVLRGQAMRWGPGLPL